MFLKELHHSFKPVSVSMSTTCPVKSLLTYEEVKSVFTTTTPRFQQVIVHSGMFSAAGPILKVPDFVKFYPPEQEHEIMLPILNSDSGSSKVSSESLGKVPAVETPADLLRTDADISVRRVQLYKHLLSNYVLLFEITDPS